jgi:hypothetical protein
MGFEELKFLNTDFQGDPVNCIVYINSIESAGKKSYVLDERNQNLWRELISNSVAVFKVFSIHKIIYDRLTSADVDYMIKHNSRLGTALNNYYGSEIVKAGNIDKVLSTITQDKLNSLEPKFREGIIRYFSGKLSVEGAPAWLAELYDQPELASYDTVETMCGTQDALDIIYKNKALMDALAVYGDFLKPVAASADLMADLVKDDPERAKTLDEIEKSDAWMHTILEDNVGLGKFIAHKSGFALTIYSNFDDMVNTTSVMNTLVANAGVLAYVQRSDLGTAKTLKWRVKRDGRTVNSMDDVFSDTELVTTIADSNGTSTDAMAILVESAPGMQVLIANDEIAEVALGTLSAANNGTAHALVTTDAGVARFDDTENYPDLYTQIFDSADRMEYLMNNEETATAIFKVPKFVKYIGESEVAMTALLASPLAIRCLDDVDEGKKLLLDCDLAAEKLVSNKYTFNYITGRPRWAHYVAYSYPMMSNIVTDYTKISPILEDEGWLSVMKDSWLALDSIMNNAASIRAFKDVIDDNNSFVDMFIESDTLTKYLTNMTSIFGSDTIVSEMSNDNTLLKVVTNSTSAMSSIMDSAVGMVSVSDSVSAMHAIANSKILVRSLIASETAFMSVIYSETAMKEIAASEIAMELIAANGTRMVNVAASSVAVNAVIASKDVALATCVASSTAMTALAASSVAMNAVAASSVAMNAVAASSVAMNAVAASSVAMNAVAASSVAVNAVIASKDVALATCVASSTAMTALAASSVAMNAVAASSVARLALYNAASTVTSILAASSTALTAMKNSSQTTTVSYTGTTSSTLYNGKAFVFEVYSSSSSSYTQYHGNYVTGTGTRTRTTSTNHETVNCFASTVTGYQNASISWTVYAYIFKI